MIYLVNKPFHPSTNPEILVNTLSAYAYINTVCNLYTHALRMLR